MKRSIALILLVATMFLIGFTGCGNNTGNIDNSWTKIKNAGTLVLGVDPTYPPMGFLDANKNVIGFDIDLAKEVCTRLGLTLKIQQIKWDSNVKELDKGTVDCLWSGYTILQDRKASVLFSEPYMINRQVFVVKADSGYLKRSDLAGKKLGISVDSDLYGSLDVNADFEMSLGKIVEIKDSTKLLISLKNGDINAALMDECDYLYNTIKDSKDYKILDGELTNVAVGIGFRKGDNALMQKIQTVLAAMSNDGKATEISKEWFGKDLTIIKH